jgi:hypothetical protein
MDIRAKNKMSSVDPARSCYGIIKGDSPAEVGKIVGDDTRRGRSQEIAGVFRRWTQGSGYTAKVSSRSDFDDVGQCFQDSMCDEPRLAACWKKGEY